MIAVGTGLAIYGSYKVYGLYTGAGFEIDSEFGFRKLNKIEDPMASLSKCNPGKINWFGKKKAKEIIAGSSDNCMLCTTCYELRRRGYDVHAGLTEEGFLADDVLPNLFSDYKGTIDINLQDLGIKPDTKNYGFLFSLFSTNSGINEKQASKVFDSIQKQINNLGDVGSRGNIIVYWNNGGGHSMIWEKRSDGIHFLDGQINKEYKDFTRDILKNISNVNPVQILRTDNLKLNKEHISDYINSDTNLKFYAKHGKEIAENILNDPDAQSVGIGAFYAGTFTAIGAAIHKGNNQIVKEYKQIHPKTKLTRSQIISVGRPEYERNTRIVDQYRKEHPKSKLSRDEILEIYRNEDRRK